MGLATVAAADIPCVLSVHVYTHTDVSSGLLVCWAQEEGTDSEWSTYQGTLVCVRWWRCFERANCKKPQNIYPRNYLCLYHRSQPRSRGMTGDRVVNGVRSQLWGEAGGRGGLFTGRVPGRFPWSPGEWFMEGTYSSKIPVHPLDSAWHSKCISWFSLTQQVHQLIQLDTTSASVASHLCVCRASFPYLITSFITAWLVFCKRQNFDSEWRLE